jgi:hypothetical protein
MSAPLPLDTSATNPIRRATREPCLGLIIDKFPFYNMYNFASTAIILQIF